MDDSISSENTDLEANPANIELPIPIDTLTMGGVAPDVGDPVKIKASCVIVRTTNGIAWGRIETINDLPVEAPVIEPDPLVDEGERLRNLSQTYGTIGSRNA